MFLEHIPKYSSRIFKKLCKIYQEIFTIFENVLEFNIYLFNLNLMFDEEKV